jgi:SAM-dependent methyltransferase
MSTGNGMNFVRKHCLFCGEKENVVELYPQNFRVEDLTPEVFSARHSGKHLHYTIVRCRNCGLVFSREILTEEALNNLYSKSNVTFSQYTDIIRKDYWRCLAPFMNGAQRNEALEIGCSSGFFLEELLARGFGQVQGCEPSIEAKELASPKIRDNITLSLFKRGLYDQKRFDLVCAFQTLDHLSDPLEIVRVSYDCLKPGGIAYFLSHDVDGFQARLLKEKSPIMDVGHIYLFNKKTLRTIFELAGFEVLKIGDVRNSYPLDYWLSMFPLPRRLRDTLRSFCRIMGVSSIPIPLKIGNMYIVAQRPL